MTEIMLANWARGYVSAGGVSAGDKVSNRSGGTNTRKVLAYMTKRTEHSKSKAVFLVKRDDWYFRFNAHYHGEPKYPNLVRIEGTPNTLATITAQHAD